MSELLKAKIALYVALLDVKEDDLSDSDYELMGILLNDPETRKFIHNALDKASGK